VASSWLFHLDLSNVIATHWGPLVAADGAVEGISVRLQETDGRAAKTKLTTIRRPKTARQVNFAGETLAELTVEGDAAWIDLSANEWAQVEVRW
jgi:hypothetical protein